MKPSCDKAGLVSRWNESGLCWRVYWGGGYETPRKIRALSAEGGAVTNETVVCLWLSLLSSCSVRVCLARRPFMQLFLTGAFCLLRRVSRGKVK